MGALFRGSRVRWVTGHPYSGEGTFLGKVVDKWTSFSGVVHEDEYYLVEFDRWPGIVTAVKPGEITLLRSGEEDDAFRQE